MLQFGIVSREFSGLLLLYLCVYIAYPIAFLLGGLPAFLKGRGALWQTALADVLCTGAALLVGGFFLGFYYSASVAVNPSLYLVGLFALLGNIFPIYNKCRPSGKGLYSLATIVLVLCPVVFAVLLLFYGLTLLATRYLSLSAVISSLLFPLILNGVFKVLIGLTPHAETTLLCILLALLITYTHRENLSAIMRGEEPKIKLARKPRD